MPKGNHGKNLPGLIIFLWCFFWPARKKPRAFTLQKIKCMHENVCKNKSMLLPVLILYCVKDRMPLLGGGWVGVATNLAHLQPRVNMHAFTLSPFIQTHQPITCRHMICCITVGQLIFCLIHYSYSQFNRQKIHILKT